MGCWPAAINMKTNELAELTAFVAVAEEKSFRRAAARLNLTPSTLSHSLRTLEERIGVRLLNRTTRTVSTTEAGQALLARIGPAFFAIESAMEAVNVFRDKPHGTVRLSVPVLAARMVLAPVLGRFAQTYPDVKLEIAANDGFVDIVRDGFDAGIRLGESLDQDMIAMPVTGEFRTAVVASPGYFSSRPPPQKPQDLREHLCIGQRGISSGALYRWEFEKDGEALALAVDGPLVLDNHDLTVAAALDGVGIACTVESVAAPHIEAGRLVRVLADWCPRYPGFFLYYPGRRQVSGALHALLEMLRRP
jgi:DNA-binding transcriptional LysR family regulator